MRRLPLSLLIAAAALVVAELGVRAASGSLPQPLRWQDWEAQNKVTAMEALSARGGASVAFVGSSMMNAAIDPVAFASGARLDRPAFDAALNGADVRTLEAWTLGVVVPLLRPRVVVIGLSSRELNDRGRNQQQQYDLFLRSPDGRRAAGEEGPADTVRRWAERASYLIRYRTVLRRPFDGSPGGGSAPGAEVDAFGTLRGIVRFAAPRYIVGADFRRRTTDQVLNDFSIGGVQSAALARLLNGLERRGITPVVVTMPVSADAIAMHPRGAPDYQRALTALRDFLRARSVHTIDLADAFPGTTLFSDPFHLTARGRQRFTDLVATDARSAAAFAAVRR